MENKQAGRQAGRCIPTYIQTGGEKHVNVDFWLVVSHCEALSAKLLLLGDDDNL